MKAEKIEWMKVAERIGAGIWIVMVAVAKATAWVSVKVFNATVAVIAALATAFVAVNSVMPADKDDLEDSADNSVILAQGEPGLDEDGNLVYSGPRSKSYYGF